MEVYVDDETKLTLHGLQQHYEKVKENEKNKKLFELLDVLEFNQVCKFCWIGALEFGVLLISNGVMVVGCHFREVDTAMRSAGATIERP